jgi:hypothetical protein
MSEVPLGDGIAEKGRATIKQRKCMNKKMGLEGKTKAQAEKECGVTSTPKPSERVNKRKGGLVKNKSDFPFTY